MRNVLLTNALAHEFQRCRDAFALYTALLFLVLGGNTDRKIAIASYNAYSDFVSHLYEFYLGCIKRDGRFSRDVSGKAVDAILNAEVKKLLKIRRERIIRGDAPRYENHVSCYEVEVPDEFGSMFRSVRNIRSHAIAERSDFDLAAFYLRYHQFVFLLFEEPQWLWNVEKFPEHDWFAIEKFSKAIVAKRP
jgi:hypothetical protein